jgi:hypothetical protein
MVSSWAAYVRHLSHAQNSSSGRKQKGSSRVGGEGVDAWRGVNVASRHASMATRTTSVYACCQWQRDSYLAAPLNWRPSLASGGFHRTAVPLGTHSPVRAAIPDTSVAGWHGRAELEWHEDPVAFSRTRTIFVDPRHIRPAVGPCSCGGTPGTALGRSWKPYGQRRAQLRKTGV